MFRVLFEATSRLMLAALKLCISRASLVLRVRGRQSFSAFDHRMDSAISEVAVSEDAEHRRINQHS